MGFYGAALIAMPVSLLLALGLGQWQGEIISPRCGGKHLLVCFGYDYIHVTSNEAEWGQRRGVYC